MTTNHPTPVILSDEALEEIEAQPSRLINGLEGILLSPAERDALCATVRALRGDYEQLSQAVAEATVTVPWEEGYSDYMPTAGDPVRSVKDLMAHICEGYERDVTALREQLAQVQAENQRLASQLKEWQEEKDTKAGYL